MHCSRNCINRREKSGKNKYEYRLEYLKHSPHHEDSRDYIAFLEDSGAEYIGSMRNWVYFRKKKSDAPFELYSDVNSRIGHLEKIKGSIGIAIAIALCIIFGIYNLFIGITLPSLVNLLCAAVLLIPGLTCLQGMRKLSQKIKELKSEGQLHE